MHQYYQANYMFNSNKLGILFLKQGKTGADSRAIPHKARPDVILYIMFGL